VIEAIKLVWPNKVLWFDADPFAEGCPCGEADQSLQSLTLGHSDVGYRPVGIEFGDLDL
jgi:hypothetical protein